METNVEKTKAIRISIKHCKRKLDKELSKEIMHSMQTEIFLKAIWCPGNQN
jgi:hypothetical protein